MTKAVLIGATGMVGQAVMAQAGALELIALARRPFDSAMENARIAPVEQWADIVRSEAPGVLISCLGTTIKVAGSQAAFRAVDHDLLLAVATAAKAAGTRRMISISSVGASSTASNFYLRTKGEVEAALRNLDFEHLDILRPGLLMGARGGPPRPGEALAMLAAPMTDALLHGSLRRYRSIAATTVARAIVALALGGGSGAHVHEHDAIAAMAATAP